MSKKAKSEVDYGFGDESERCGICKHARLHLMVAGTCTEVQGVIVSVDWCKLFEKKVESASTPQE